MLKAYLDKLSLHLVEKMLENLSMSVEQSSQSAKIFRRKVLALPHWVPHSSDMSLQHWVLLLYFFCVEVSILKLVGNKILK